MVYLAWTCWYVAPWTKARTVNLTTANAMGIGFEIIAIIQMALQALEEFSRA